MIDDGDVFFCKSFWHASMLAVKTRRRLHTARIDVKLCEGVADDARKKSPKPEVKKRKYPPSRNRTSDLRITISHSLPLFRELGVLDADFTLLYRQVYSPPLYQLSYRGQELIHFGRTSFF